MKTIGILIIGLIISICGYGQDLNNESHLIDVVEIMPPEFVGSTHWADVVNGNKRESLDDYLVRNIQFPETPEGYAYVEGTEVVGFDVTEEGRIANFTIINSVSPAIDAELIRVLETTEGMWKPGYKNGIATKTDREVSMAFKVSSTEKKALEKSFLEISKKQFLKGSEALFMKNKPRKALAYFNKAVRYTPYECNVLFMRGLCLFELGDIEAAQRDLNRINEYEFMRNAFDIDPEVLVKNVKDTKVYEEVISRMNELYSNK